MTILISPTQKMAFVPNIQNCANLTCWYSFIMGNPWPQVSQNCLNICCKPIWGHNWITGLILCIQTSDKWVTCGQFECFMTFWPLLTCILIEFAYNSYHQKELFRAKIWWVFFCSNIYNFSVMAISISPTPKMSYQIYYSRSAYFTTELPLSPSLFNVNILKIKVYGYSHKKKLVWSIGGGGARWAPLAHRLLGRTVLPQYKMLQTDDRQTDDTVYQRLDR